MNPEVLLIMEEGVWVSRAHISIHYGQHILEIVD